MPDDIESGDWREYKLLVVEGLRGVKKDVKDLRSEVDRSFTKISEVSADIASLRTEVKASARNWGLLAGIIPAVLVLALWKLLAG